MSLEYVDWGWIAVVIVSWLIITWLCRCLIVILLWLLVIVLLWSLVIVWLSCCRKSSLEGWTFSLWCHIRSRGSLVAVKIVILCWNYWLYRSWIGTELSGCFAWLGVVSWIQVDFWIFSVLAIVNFAILKLWIEWVSVIVDCWWWDVQVSSGWVETVFIGAIADFTKLSITVNVPVFAWIWW